MSHLAHYHADNYPRKFNTDSFYQKIIGQVVTKIGRPLTKPEKDETVSFIKKMDPDLLAPTYINKTIGIMVTTLADEFKKFNCTTPQFVDSQQILKQTIGISSESGTSHSIYDNPNYQLTRAQTDRVDYSTKQQPKEDEPLDIKFLVTEGGGITSGKKKSTESSNAPSISNLLGMTNADEAVRILNPSSLLRKNYLMLDSRYRVLDNDNDGKITSFRWTYILQSQASAQGTVNIIGNVRDIVALRVYPFRIPYIASADNKYSRISVHIDEFAQSFIGHENRKFHFMLQSEIDSAFINLLTNKYNDGFFYFEKPVPEIKTLTITFGSPIEPIVFDRDRDVCQIDYFSIAPLTKITTGLPTSLNKHNLSNGDRVYFSNFDVGVINPTLTQQVEINQGIKKKINRSEGFLITVIDPFNFSIDCDTSNIQNPLPDPLAVPLLDIFVFDVFYGSKRIFLPIELTYIMPESGHNSE